MAELRDAYALCRRVAHLHGPNFSVGFRFLPHAKREAVYVAYAFCRFADDIVDENPTADVNHRIDRWEKELDRCYEDKPTHPITLALADVVARYPVPKTAFSDLIAGCRMDLTKNRYATFDELLIYSDLVATTISTMSLSIFGYHDPTAVDRGRDLATAFQLTNIVRDVGEDARRNRIYLPQEELCRFGVKEEDLLRPQPTPAFVELMRFQVARVNHLYGKAEPVLDLIEPDARRCTALMGAVYHRVLARIEELGFPVLTRRVQLSLGGKLALIGRALASRKPTWNHTS